MSLTRDMTVVPGQNFALVSFVGPPDSDMPQKADAWGIKIRGVFSSQEEAGQWAKKLQQEDSLFNIYVVDMYKWLHIPPPSDIDDIHYQNEELEKLIQGHREAQRTGKLEFEKRRQELKSGSIDPSDEHSHHYTKDAPDMVEHPADKLARLKKENPDKTEKELVEQIIHSSSQEKSDSGSEPSTSSPDSNGSSPSDE